MDRIFILLGLIVVVSVVNSQDVGSCLDTVLFNRHCCINVITEENKTIMKECLHSRHEPQTCYFENCYGERKGFLMTNGTVDKIQLNESLIRDFENYTSIYDVVKVKCLNDDLSAYSQEDTCYLREIGNCIQFTIMANCPKWIESDECMKVKDIVQDCTKLFP